MIHRVKGELVCECTDCGTEYAGGCEEDFSAFVEELKAEGWMVQNEDEEWVHRCPGCAEENYA